jgi:hypothetical protein
MIFSTPFILLTIIHPDYKCFGTIVTFDGGYSLWRHYHKDNSNDFFKEEEEQDFIISMGKKEEKYG